MGFRSQGDDLREIRVDEGRGQHLVIVLRFAVVALPRQALVAVDLVGAKVFNAVQAYQVTTVQKDERLEELAWLQQAADISESRAELEGIHVVQDATHLGVAGEGLETEDTVEVVIEGAVGEGQQRRILEGEQGQSGHQGIGPGEGGITAWLRKFGEALAEALDQGVEVELLPQAWRSSGGGGHGGGLRQGPDKGKQE